MPHATVNSFRIFYEEYGDPNGKPVVLVPGLGGTHQSWLDIGRLLQDSCRVIAVDPRDAGASDRASSQYTIANMAWDIAGLMDHLSIRSAGLAGYSMGSAIAQEIAISRPDLVRALVLAASYDAGDRRGTALFEQFARLRRLLSKEDYARTLLPWLYTYKELESINPEDVISSMSGDTEFQEPEAYERQMRATVSFKSRERLNRIAVPTLLLFGDEDLLTPLRFGRSLEAGIRGSKLIILAGAGHAMYRTRSAELAALIGGFFSGTP